MDLYERWKIVVWWITYLFWGQDMFYLLIYLFIFLLLLLLLVLSND